jgi:hypothetical protein
MSIHGTFDLDKNHWIISDEPDGEISISFVSSSDNEIDISNFRFGFVVFVDGNKVLEKTFPGKREVFKKVDSDFVFSGIAPIKPGQIGDVTFWLEENLTRIESKFEFSIPMPESPFPSWVWNGDDWESPIPYPDSDFEGYYTWDEESFSWIAVED